MGKNMLRTILFMLLVIKSLVAGDDLIVKISNGKVKGELMTTPNNKTFYAFRGIPYAKPPLGELRFQPPQKPDNWEGVLDSDAKDRMCIQLTSNLQPNESEDCLYIHVYTPQIPKEGRNVSLPVMYVIHGGGFETGSPSEIGPQYLMDYDMVIVYVGYRLCFLGFLSTEDLNCPGNNGLKDQQLGLKWVQRNIQSFGGDPKRVTIYGESAGAASVSFHLLAPNSKNLFIGAIQDSGSSLANWAIQTKPTKIAYDFANRINSTINENNTSTLELLKFFRTLDVQQIKKTSVELFKEGFIESYNKLILGFGFSGAVEPEHDNAFLAKSPYQSFLSGDFYKVPTLIGVNSEESLFLAVDPNLEKRMMYFDNNTEWYLSRNIDVGNLTTRKLVGKKIRDIYDPSAPLHQNEALSIKYFSDTSFIRPTLKQAQLQSYHTDVYFYELAYYGDIAIAPIPDVPGAGKVSHAQDLMYLFARFGVTNVTSEGDKTTMKRMLTMWTNFVKYQNPTPKPLQLLQNTTWSKIESLGMMPYLLINDTLKVEHNYKKKMMDEYQQIFDYYAQPPLTTY
ncbi:juvenile hormone esterase-like [Harmonia axyridis]|uniref:juvenile hormone esterase-like n=1 Tax=Harmonia axyridis TaxID=115357 RepID=UPI001E275C4E|nr:juvenile hormone esterase-like [Harmonia axyridis]